MAFQTADVFERQVIRTGNHALDEVLDGGLELGLMHLLYGAKVLNRDLLRMAVHAQLPIEQGGLATPSIIIDSNKAWSGVEITRAGGQGEIGQIIASQRYGE